MSAALVKAEVERFLNSTRPEVLCISGKWGVGKTYAWNRYLRNAQAGQHVHFDRYSYVSLFGRASLADVRDAIVENTVDAKRPGLVPDLSSFDGILSGAFKATKYLKPFLPLIPKSSSYAEGANRLLYLAVKQQIVCIDDLERAGAAIRVVDILGLASELKELKKCKVVLLLNDAELKDHAEFKTQIEKVADVSIVFLPTAEEAAEIGVDTALPLAEDLRKACIELGIVNIRTIKKAERLVAIYYDIIKDFDRRIVQEGARTLVLGAYAKYQPKEAPPLDFIRTHSHMATLMTRAKGMSDEDKAFDNRLAAYGYTSTSDLDTALLDGVDTGALDGAKIQTIASAMQQELIATDRNQALRDAWRRYHDSFKDDEAEFVEELIGAIRQHLDLTTLNTLNSATSMLRDLGRDAQADELLGFYMANKQMPPGFWDLSEHHLLTQTLDPAVRAAFEQRFAEVQTLPAMEPTLRKVMIGDGWNPEDIKALAAASPQEYFDLFKRIDDPELSGLVTAALRFGDFGNAGAEMRQIAGNATAALRRIAAENRFNAVRAGRFRLPPEEPARSPASEAE